MKKKRVSKKKVKITRRLVNRIPSQNIAVIEENGNVFKVCCHMKRDTGAVFVAWLNGGQSVLLEDYLSGKSNLNP